MDKDYTQEESDALILEEMGLADENSTINEVEEETEVETEEVETEDETETEEDEEQEEEVVKPKKGIAKVLHQRNEARKEAEKAKTLAQELQEKLDQLNDEGNYGTEEYIQTLVDKRLAEGDEKQEFFNDNEELKSYRKDILSYSKETGLSLEKASKLFLAENAPELLLDKETRNKQKSKIYQTPNVTSKKLKEGKFDYSDKEFEDMAKKGLIKF